MNTLELLNPKVLIRPDQADKAKGKNIIIGEQRRNEKLSLEETPKIAAKASTLGGGGKTLQKKPTVHRPVWPLPRAV
jgi:hypothetical protein